MTDAIEVAPGVVVPSWAIEVRASRASGPGGQNVNKVASRIELLVDLSLVEGLPDAARARLLSLAGRRRDAEGRLRVVSQESRDQRRNLESAREKARALVARALVAPKPRKRTRPTAASRERRLAGKRRDALVKVARRRLASDVE
ncbi:aminoacyl-tRNA hydrolase [Acidobacteria bacterium ACD]|nr:MAG: aminoacyl-tRNA hydrolase [Acidobacteriota bacterium]MDL1950773.1 aminoacyl-tRNA hydrolase [Acidobacteria bacterium ACD]